MSTDTRPTPYTLAALSPRARRQRAARKGKDTKARNQRTAAREQAVINPLSQNIGSMFPQLTTIINTTERTPQ